MQRMVASACLAAGVFILFGLGPALLVAGVLLWFRDDRAVEWVRDQWARAIALYQWVAVRVAAVPRRVIAGASMGTGLVATPVGMSIAFGVGAGLVAAGVALFGFALIVGEGA